MKLKEGTQFVILGQKNTIVLRRIEISSEKLALRKTLQRFRGTAQKSGFTKREVERLSKGSRKKSSFRETNSR